MRLEAWEPIGEERRDDPGLDAEAPVAADGQWALPLPPMERDPRDLPQLGAANRAAAALLCAPERWPRGLGCLIGPRGSGKSLLVAGFWPDARVIARIEDLTAFALGGPAPAGARIVIEDLDALLRAEAAAEPAARLGVAERAVFHLANRVAEARAALLATGRRAPALWDVALPDLRSRLAGAALARIEAPEPDLLAAVLARRFAARGVRVAPSVIRYLALRLERSFAAAADAVDRLERAALAEGGPVDAKLARQVFGWP